jgi:hypothetical protein
VQSSCLVWDWSEVRLLQLGCQNQQPGKSSNVILLGGSFLISSVMELALEGALLQRCIVRPAGGRGVCGFMMTQWLGDVVDQVCLRPEGEQGGTDC